MSDTEQHDLPEKLLGPHASRMGVNYGLTKNLQNFESARVDVYVEDYCEPDKKKEKIAELSKISWDYVHKASGHIAEFVEKKRILDQQRQQAGGLG